MIKQLGNIFYNRNYDQIKILYDKTKLMTKLIIDINYASQNNIVINLKKIIIIDNLTSAFLI